MLRLSILADRLSVCRLSEPQAVAIPAWATGSGFWSVTRAPGELSVICDEARVPASVKCEKGWRALRVHGPLDFTQIGILSALSGVLADAGISLLALSTFDTDYLLVKESALELARQSLEASGYDVPEGR